MTASPSGTSQVSPVTTQASRMGPCDLIESCYIAISSCYGVGDIPGYKRTISFHGKLTLGR
jgi:hypothetical protein